MQRMGERIKKQRETMVMQLSKLAKGVGVTVSCLSQIENGKAFPSIVTLKKIADNLNTTVGELIGEHETLTKNPVIKESEKKFVKRTSKGTILYLLSHHDQNKQMETYFVSFNKNSASGNIITKHPGQEFCYILNGALEITLNDKKYILNKGDSIYLNSNTHHAVKNINNGKSEMLWIITPPNI